MRIKLPLVISIIILLLIHQSGKAQETHFAQFYASGAYLNPALTGAEGNTKLTLNYRNHWPQISNSFVTYNVGFEQAMQDKNAAWGMNVYRDQAGDGKLTVTSYNASYAYEIKLNREWRLRTAMKIGVVEKNLDWGRLVFEDMIDSRQGIVYTSTQQLSGKPVRFVDVSAGGLFYSEHYFAGFAVDHLNTPEASFIRKNGTYRIQRNYTLHAGGKFYMNGRKNNQFSPNLLVSLQQNLVQVSAGAYMETGPMIVGAWFGNQDVVTALLGLRGERFRFAYSYDMYTSTITGSSLGSHEISYTYLLASKEKVKRYKTTPCPVF
jgi:type IX secretion system PorP/SprF family membrane protein